MGSLEGKHCFVTGGTSGIGKATVELFAACNAKAYPIKEALLKRLSFGC